MTIRLACAAASAAWACVAVGSVHPVDLPEVFAPGSTILFQGDSITDGFHKGDMNHVYGHGYACEIASRYQALRPDLKLQFANRGVSGNTSSNLVERWARDAFPYAIAENGYDQAFDRRKGDRVVPDTVSVLIGINDYFHDLRKDGRGVTCEQYERNLRRLVADTRAANPKAKIVLCEPFRIPTDATVEFCRRQAVVADLAWEFDCAFVPFQKLYSEDLMRENPRRGYWFWDFFHPTPAGHYRMADFWIDAVARHARRAARNTALEPRAKIEDDSYDWFERHRKIVETQKALDPEIVFIGDSITHGWEANDRLRGDAKAVFDKWFGRYRPLNMGFGWDRIQNVLWRLGHGEMDGTKPKTVVVMIGTNNTAPGHRRPFPANTPDEIADGIIEVCRRVREKAPAAKIVLMDVFPRGAKDSEGRQGVVRINAALGPKVAALADANLVRFSVWDRFVGPDGNIPKELMFDSLHPTAKGYDLWGAALTEFLAKRRGDGAPGKVLVVAPENPRYFADGQTGKTWIPVGCNICFDRLYDGVKHGDAEVRANFERWLRKFAANGGNCIRLWAGHKSLEVMPEKPGVYDPEKTKTLKGIVALCEDLGIKVKITFESFRMCLSEEIERKRDNPKGCNFNYNHVFNRRLYAPYADSVAAFFKSEECRRIYLGKAQYLKDLGFGDSSAVYCWELWNEINCCGTIKEYSDWSLWALAELKRMFPRQMTVNNLGSFSDVGAYQMYDELATEKDNDFMQIHRYLDSGACLDVCRGPMDIVAASAVRELLDRRPDRPAIVAEIGAVQANHAGPFPYYPFDREGTLLHDALFAAFFAGSAGCGQFWHWDHQYIDANDLWWHFRRFANAIEGLDPVAEGFRPFYTESRRLRMYGLRGRKTAVVWCRDKRNSWEDELVHGDRPELLTAEIVPFRNCRLDCYLPWEDRRLTADAPNLPPFRRSIVVRVPSDAVEGVVRPH